MLKIKVINYETGESYERKLTPGALTKREFIIGRYPICNLILSSPEVSRMHAKVECKMGQYYFTDLGSTCGSQINGEEVFPNQPLLLKPNDVIRIGDFILLLHEEVELKGDRRVDRRPDENGSKLNAVQINQLLAKKKVYLNNDHTLAHRSDSPVVKVDPVQINQLLFKAEELKNQGIYRQGSSEFRFRGRLLVEGISLSRHLRQKAIDLCQAKLDTGKFCVLVDHSDHFTIWQEKPIK